MRVVIVEPQPLKKSLQGTGPATCSALVLTNRRLELVWECKTGLLPILQPQIRLYYLPPEIATIP